MRARILIHAVLALALGATIVWAQPRAAQPPPAPGTREPGSPGTTRQPASVAAQPAGSVRLSVELPDNPMVGARLFVSKQCVRCHALGSGQTPIGPDLGRIRFPGTVLDLAGAFWTHSPMMREKMKDLKIQRPTFSTAEMADLLAFLSAYRYYLTRVGEPANPLAGKAVFAAKRCDTCHAGREDWGKPAPSLDQYRGRFSAIFLAQAMWNHGRDMAAVMRQYRVRWPEFAGQEMGDLVAYLQAGDGGGGPERVYFEPGSPRRGRDLFAEKRCNVCHAIAGVGGDVGPDLGALEKELVGSVASIAGLMWNHSLGMNDEFQQRGIRRVEFSGQEMADIIAYLYFVNYANVRGTPARGGEVFVKKCSTCHTMGGGRRVGPDLETVVGLDDPIAIVRTMWNHAPEMEQEHRKRGLAFPQFATGEVADLAAFLLSRRAAAGEKKVVATQ